MPTYEYSCTDCGNRVEVVQRIDDDPPETCEVCGGELRKLFHPVGVVLKGSGFYRTDSRSNGGPKKEGKDKPEPSKGSKEKPGSAGDRPGTPAKEGP